MKSLTFILALTLLLAAKAGATPFSTDLTADVFDSTPDGIPTPNDDNDGIPDLNDAVNLLAGTSFANNEDIDHLQIPSTADNTWISPTGDGTLVLIGLTAGFSNVLGVYSDLGAGTSKLPLLGPDSGFGFEGDGTLLDPFRGVSGGGFPPDPFGFYLDSTSVDPTSGTPTTTTYFSEPSLNPDGIEHMVAYDLTSLLAGSTTFVDFFGGPGPVEYTFSSPVLVGWEDLRFDAPPPGFPGLLADDDFDDMMYIFDSVVPVDPNGVPSGGSTSVFLVFALACLATGLRLKDRFTS